jgi:hypothetical protein
VREGGDLRVPDVYFVMISMKNLTFVVPCVFLGDSARSRFIWMSLCCSVRFLLRLLVR